MNDHDHDHDHQGPIPMTSASAHRLGEACYGAVMREHDDMEEIKDALAKAVAGLFNCAATLERLEQVERALDHERQARREAETEVRAVKAGALDRMELAGGLSEGALLEAVRLVRYHLTTAGAPSMLSTVGLADWARQRIMGG